MSPTDHIQQYRTPISADDILAAFDAAGLRNTRPRRLIAERLADQARSGRDFATDELWQELQKRDPGLGRATIYRAVDTLVTLRLLDRIEMGNGTHRYRMCGEGHHHHLVCTACGQIEEFDLCLPEQSLEATADHAGYSMEWHSLEIFGHCPQCRASQAAP